LILLVFLLSLALPRQLNAHGREDSRAGALLSTKQRQRIQGSARSQLSAIGAQHVGSEATDQSQTSAETAGGAIREVFPDKYKQRYQAWKKQLLRSESCRKQWETYAHHASLVLRITSLEISRIGEPLANSDGTSRAISLRQLSRWEVESIRATQIQLSTRC
jgi:hypothetical protein